MCMILNDYDIRTPIGAAFGAFKIMFINNYTRLYSF